MKQDVSHSAPVGNRISVVGAKPTRESGAPLTSGVRTDMERSFSHDFSQVRVHTDASAAHSAESLDANAFTHGSDVAFASGRYQPETRAGRHLLAHELAHVVQQGGSGDASSGTAHEAEADLAADTVASGRTTKISLSAGPSIARAPHNDRGFGGEQGAGFQLYSQQQGWQVIEGPSGAGGHNANASGFDAITYNPRLDELHIVDNKSLKRSGNVASATAIDPARNLARNLDDAIDRLTAAKDIPNRIRVIELLRATRRALAGGGAIPAKVRLVVRGIGGNSSGVTAALRGRGVEFIPENAPTPLPGSGTPGSQAGGAQPPPNAGTVNTPPSAATNEALPDATPPPKSAAPATAKPPAKPPANTTTEIIPEAAPGGKAAPRPGAARPGRGFRFGMSAAKMLGPMILDMANRYFMAKEEFAHASAAIEAKLDSNDVTSKIEALIDLNRLDIARRQHKGSTVYATVAIKVAFTNDVMDRLSLRSVNLSYLDESNFMSSVMSHDGLTGAEGKVWWVETSLPLDKVEVSKSEATQFDLDDLDDTVSNSSMAPDALGRMNQQRNELLARKQRELAEEAAEKKRQLESAAVLPDAKKRAQQQQEIVDELRKIKPAAPPATAPKSQGAGPPPSGSFLPPAQQQQPAGPSLFGSNDGPIQIAAKKVEEAKAWAQRLEKKGIELRDRVSGSNAPSPAERQAFFDEEKLFRLQVKAWQNHFQNESRAEAVNALGELIDRVGPKLAEIRTQLGG